MEPTLRAGDWLLVWRGVAGRGVGIRPGRLVVARHPERDDVLLVKRAADLRPGGWWLESDNAAPGAVDSRRFGPVPPGLIEGRVLARYHRGTQSP